MQYGERAAVFRIRIRIHRIHVFFSLPDPDPSIIMKKEHAAQVREEPLRTVEADDADAVARLQAQLDEGLAKKEYRTFF
jgi:hypothetical protein